MMHNEMADKIAEMNLRSDVIAKEIELFKIMIAMEDVPAIRHQRDIVKELMSSFEQDYEKYFGVKVDATIRFPEEG